MERITPDFSYEKTVLNFTSGYILKGKYFRGSIVKFRTLYRDPEPGTEQVEMYHFSPREQAVGSVLILHGLGTRNIPFFMWLALRLSCVGVESSLLILPGHYTRTAHNSTSGKDYFISNLKRLIKFWEHAVVDVRSSIDLMEQRGMWKENNCLLGYCLGGMISVLATALDRRIKHTILLTAGGNMARLLWHSPTLKFTRRGFARGEGSEESLNSRDELMSRYEQDMRMLDHFESVDEMLQSRIHSLLKVDPISYAKFVGKERTTFVEALFDRALPRDSRRILWERLGRPRRYFIPLGHVSWLPFQFLLGEFVLKKMGIRSARRQLRLLQKLKIEEK